MLEWWSDEMGRFYISSFQHSITSFAVNVTSHKLRCRFGRNKFVAFHCDSDVRGQAYRIQFCRG